jgi:predicted ATPase/DNA-binding XRE family transcriptional regulator
MCVRLRLSDAGERWISVGLVRLEAEGFGSQLRRYRILAGCSQEALAARAGLSRRGIADLERGVRRFPYPDTASRLADALGLGGADREAFLAASRPSRSGRHLLPADPSGFVGRQAEIAALKALIGDVRLLTLTGTAGIGKTRVALELARQIESQYADGAVFVDLAPLVDIDLVPDAVALALGVKGKPAEPAIDRVCEYARSKKLLLVLDNCEHLLTGCARLIDVLIRSCPGGRVIATSRQPLHIPGETVWTVPPLAAEEAVALFVGRARASNASMPLEVDAVGVVRDICLRLEGIPLAIELAAARVPALGVAQIADLLADRLGLLKSGNPLDPPRHQTLRAALEWSYALLDQTERRLFRRLTVFAGGWDLEAANAVCARGALAPNEILDSLVGLCDKSLVLAEDVGGRRRYRFMETIREYGAERFAESDEVGPVRARHVSYFLAMVKASAVTRAGVDYPGDVARVRREHDNVRAALRWLLDRHDYEQGLELGQALSGFWVSQGFLAEGDEWLARFLARPDAVPQRTFAAGLHSRGRFAEYGGALDRAAELYEQSLSASIKAGDATVSARALCGLGDVATHQGSYVRAMDLFHEALDAARSVDSAQETLHALLCLGRAANLRGDHEHSRAWLERALAIARQLDDRWSVAYVLNELGQHARRNGQLGQAQALLEECHLLWQEIGTQMGQRAAVMNLALVTLERGALRRAAELARECLELSRDMHDDGSVTTVRCVEIAALVLHVLASTWIAVFLIASATAQREVLGAPRPSAEQVELDRLLAAARAELATPVLEVEWQRGRDLPIHEAVDQAAASLTAGLEGPSH